MDQHSARPGGASAPSPATGAKAYPEAYPGTAPGAAPGKPARPLTGTVRRLRAVQRPRLRLTGLGTGVLVTVVTVLAGTADAMFFDGPGVLFGVVFVAVSATAAVYVRPYDLVAAPVSAPIAFAVAIGLTGDNGDGGLVGHLLGLFTGLALMTGWLYTGTVLAALIVGIRALRLPSRRRRSRRCSAARRGRSPR